MIIPSIDLMDGRVVQLRQGNERVLTYHRDPFELVKKFNRYGPVAVIDLDAALGQGNNIDCIRAMCRMAEVRVGGGIRDEETGRAYLRAGATQLIIGTAANPKFLSKFPVDRLIVALDHRNEKVVDYGWTRSTGESIQDRAKRLVEYCSGFLVTFVDQEGEMTGIDVPFIAEKLKGIEGSITVAGGITSAGQISDLDQLGYHGQVGMSLYQGRLNLADAFIDCIDFKKNVPTIIQDVHGQVLTLAYSSPESLRLAFEQGKGIYFSRSRNEIWEKGQTSGHTQRLISCRADCDRDALLFTVEQTGRACHTPTYSCFGQRQFSISGLAEILQQLIVQSPEGSYTAKLASDLELLRSKITEEAHEVIRADNFEDLRWEIGDALYHLLVLTLSRGLRWSDIESELRARQRRI